MNRTLLAFASSLALFACATKPAEPPPVHPHGDKHGHDEDGDEHDHDHEDGSRHHDKEHGEHGDEHCHEHHDHEPGAPLAHAGTGKAVVISHKDLRAFENNGNQLIGLATPSLGGGRIEVWRSSILPGKKTPRHTHTSEEVFIVLKGSGRFLVGDATYDFAAPCTVIAPANVTHQLENTGSEPTEQFVIVEAGSTISDADGRELHLPWRK